MKAAHLGADKRRERHWLLQPDSRAPFRLLRVANPQSVDGSWNCPTRAAKGRWSNFFRAAFIAF
jgi:hypothetical protein